VDNFIERNPNDVLVFGPNGKSVRARTANQKRMVTASEKNDIMFAINIPQESVTIPETMDGIRAAMGMQTDRLKAVAATNNYLGLGKWKTK